MNVIVCKDESAWVEAVNSWLRSQLTVFQARSLFLPAGETPRPLYASWESRGAPFGPHVRLVQLDEIINGSRRGAFRSFFQETLPSLQAQFDYINQAETGAELALLGLGVNGHVAFHEPGIAKNFYSGCVQLSRETIERNSLSPDSRAVTYGVAAFMRSKAVGLIVRGAAKKQILQKVLEPRCELPAAFLKEHPHLTIVTDFEV